MDVRSHEAKRRPRADELLVRSIIESAGSRGASHEDFVQAGLARDYIRALQQLADEGGLRIRTDFTSGQVRWARLA
jgi:hypothetical protein